MRSNVIRRAPYKVVDVEFQCQAGEDVNKSTFVIEGRELAFASDRRVVIVVVTGADAHAPEIEQVIGSLRVL